MNKSPLILIALCVILVYGYLNPGMDQLLLYIVIAGFSIALIAAIIMAKTPMTIKSHWQTFLDGFQIGTNELYTQVRAGLKERHINHVDINEETFLESHLLSAKRLYLRVTQNEFVFYFCCAQYGTGTFVSSWLCIKNERLINKIPFVSKLVGKDRNNKTFYQMDTELMFRSGVHNTVVAVVDAMSEAKGKRGLTDVEKQFKDVR
jgi:hypothetical protein